MTSSLNSPADHYDLVFVGSGLSTTITLIKLIERLRVAPQPFKPSILVVEKTPEFCTGIAYGQRTGINSLTITSLRDFLPARERSLFTDWLDQNSQAVMQKLQDYGGDLSDQWLVKNRDAIQQGDWDDIFIPRFMFGQFLQEYFDRVVADARDEGIVCVDCLVSTVTNIAKYDDQFHVVLESDSDPERTIIANKVVLGFGNPQSKPGFENAAKTLDSCCVIEDPYGPGNGNCVRTVLGKLSDQDCENNILIVGSNASAIEIVYRIVDTPGHKVDKVIVISPEGEFPQPMESANEDSKFVPKHLNALQELQSVSASEVYAAAKQDILDAETQSTEISESFVPISHAVSRCFSRFDERERLRFTQEFGVKIGKLQRRAGDSYIVAVESLANSGELLMVKGRCTGEFEQPEHPENGAIFYYVDETGKNRKPFPVPIQAVFNCAGTRTLDQLNPDSLIWKLIDSGLCQPNASNRGFHVDDQLQTSQGLFVIGPLLAGNIVKNLMIWHAEHCGRLINLAGVLSNALSSALGQSFEDGNCGRVRQPSDHH